MTKQQGFTIVEVVVITLIIGIVSAIAVPSWTNFLETERLNSSQIKLFQAVASAKSMARTEKRPVRLVVFETNVAIDGRRQKQFDEGITGVPNEIVFDFQGNPHRNTELPLYLTVTSRNQRACVGVMTLIGSVRSLQNQQCP